jgi:LacI family transcriptional regulator
MATIKDVARLAGVGLGTASRAISGRGPVSAQARARVKEAIETLGFRPSNVARALSTKSAGMIGIYVPDFSGLFYGPILRAIDGELRRANRHMVAASGHGHGDPRQQALEGIDFLIQRECDGVLVVSHMLTDDDVDGLYGRFPRVAILNRALPVQPLHAFSSDHALCGRLAARALLERGHRDIACIAGPDHAPDNAARMAGFFEELRSARIRIPQRRRATGDFSFDGGERAARQLLAQGPVDYTALFCANDVMAMAALACLATAGIAVPGTLSVLGYDDSEIARYTTPALATVRVPIERAAVNGCRFLLNLCYGLELPVEHALAPELILRASLGAGPHGAPAARVVPPGGARSSSRPDRRVVASNDSPHAAGRIEDSPGRT